MNRALKILLITNGMVLIAGAMIGPIYAIFVEKIGGDILTVGSTFAIFPLTAGIVTFILGKFEDRIKEQELAVVWGYLIMTLGFFGYLIVKSPLSLFIIQIIIGIGEAINTPAFDAVYDKHVARKEAAFQWGAWEAMRYIAIAAGGFAGALIVKFFGFPVLFITMGILVFVSAVYIYFLPRKVL